MQVQELILLAFEFELCVKNHEWHDPLAMRQVGRGTAVGQDSWYFHNINNLKWKTVKPLQYKDGFHLFCINSG